MRRPVIKLEINCLQALIWTTLTTLRRRQSKQEHFGVFQLLLELSGCEGGQHGGGCEEILWEFYCNHCQQPPQPPTFALPGPLSKPHFCPQNFFEYQIMISCTFDCQNIPLSFGVPRYVLSSKRGNRNHIFQNFWALKCFADTHFSFLSSHSWYWWWWWWSRSCFCLILLRFCHIALSKLHFCHF